MTESFEKFLKECKILPDNMSVYTLKILKTTWEAAYKTGVIEGENAFLISDN